MWPLTLRQGVLGTVVLCVYMCSRHILIFLLQAAVMQMQMSEAELSDLSHTREPSSKKGTDKHNSRVSSYNDLVLIFQ